MPALRRAFIVLGGCAFVGLVAVWWSPQSTPAVAPTPPPTAVLAPVVGAPEAPAEVTAVASLDTALARFEAWTRRYLAAGNSEIRAALIAEGVALARERRPAFLELITNEPKRALEEAVPLLVRQELPPEVVAQLEERVNGRGTLRTYLSRPVADAVQPPALRHAELDDGCFYQVHVTGTDQFQVAPVAERSLIGVAMKPDDGGKAQFALASRRVLPLPVGYVPPAAVPKVFACPVSGKTSPAAADQPITEATPAVAANGTIVYLCDGSHTTVFEQDLIQGEGATGGPQPLSGALPHATTKSKGMLKVLFIPMTFQDQNAAPASEATCYAVMQTVQDFYASSSFGKLTILATVTPPVRLPRSEAWYIAKDSEVDGLGLEHSDARSEARKLGYDATAFDTTVVRLNGGPRATGGWGGGGSVWTYYDDPGIVAHEIGHTFGLGHANYWNTAGVSTIGSGSSQEYGDAFDVMGGGGVPRGHYNIWAKRQVGWLTDDNLTNVVESGTYRIFAHDANTLDPARRYGLRLAKDSVRTYYVETRQLRDSDPNQVWLKSGAIIEWRWPARAGNNLLLDTTPGSLHGKADGVLTLGRTFSDREAGLHCTPVAVNFGAQKSVDVVVNIGAFPGNHAPAVSLAASELNVAPGTTITFTATASDADGDALAYFWDFGDGTVAANAPTVQREFADAGQYHVACTVSDMKGGTTTRFAVIQVGTPSTFTIAGRVTLDGQPLGNIAVSDGTKEVLTDADGHYTLTGLEAGGHTVVPRLEGYTFASALPQPVAVDPDANGADFTATGGVFLTLAASVATCGEGSAVPGRFTLTRTGNLGAALTVRVQTISGSATITGDYTLSPNVAASTFTIPAGAASREILVLPVNDTAAEGPEAVTIQLVPDAAYVISGSGEATVTIDDDDTTLPKVSLVANKAVTTEDSAQGAEFTVTRSGPTASALTVEYAASGTALAGADFAPLSGSMVIPGGAASAVIALATLDDTMNESNETVTLTLANSANYIIGGVGAATATIVDDDVQIISVTMPDASATEKPSGAADTAAFLVSRSGEISQPLTVYYSLAGSALHGVDYEILPGFATIPAGRTTVAIGIVPIADSLGEGTESVTLQLASLGTNYRLAATSTSTVTINDAPTDLPYVEVIAIDGFCAEPGDIGKLRFTSKGSGPPLTVNYIVSGTATSGSDFVALSGSVTLTGGSSTRTAEVTVTPIDDAAPEDLETITVTIAPGTSYQTWSASRAATMWLRDDEQPTVFVDAHSTQPSEGGLPSGFYISRVGSTAGTLVVNYILSGRATNGVDYEALGGAATIAAGARGVEVPLTPIQDALAEGTEKIVMSLASGGYSRSPLSAALDLGDDDAPATTVQFATAAGGGLESAGTVNIPVLLATAAPGEVTVEFGVGSGDNTATGAGVDYETVSGTLTFPPGVTSQNIALALRDDALREADERVVIKLKNPTGAMLAANSVHTYTIVDDDFAQQIELWRIAHFGADAGDALWAGDLADPDQDGLQNLLEYALDLDPLAPGPPGVVADLETVGAENFLRLTVPKNPGASDVGLAVEVSGDLTNTASWSSATTTVELDAPGTLQVRDNIPQSAAAQRAVRLKVTRP